MFKVGLSTESINLLIQLILSSVSRLKSKSTFHTQSNSRHVYQTHSTNLLLLCRQSRGPVVCSGLLFFCFVFNWRSVYWAVNWDGLEPFSFSERKKMTNTWSVFNLTKKRDGFRAAYMPETCNAPSMHLIPWSFLVCDANDLEFPNY